VEAAMSARVSTPRRGRPKKVAPTEVVPVTIEPRDPKDPFVPVDKSVFENHVVCLDCGFHAKMLKRHLMTEHAMTHEQYRAKWSLPTTSPVVAPA